MQGSPKKLEPSCFFSVIWGLHLWFCFQLHFVIDWLISPDGILGNSAELFEKVSQNVKVKRYSEALDDLNAAIEADPKLSEAYFHRGSILRQLCRFPPRPPLVLDIHCKLWHQFRENV